HLCEVTEVEPGRKLTYSWRYDGYEGISYVTFELFPQGEKTRLVLTHSGLETFPESNPDLARANFEAGWADFIGNYLPGYV
ncbi:SRPBCC domain-containing protein, partial [Escherichia coli]|uniref:SRPBCC family protein n=1 Tax=Escherichia coli TaxID=562 RepID=UPI00386290C0